MKNFWRTDSSSDRIMLGFFVRSYHNSSRRHRQLEKFQIALPPVAKEMQLVKMSQKSPVGICQRAYWLRNFLRPSKTCTSHLANASPKFDQGFGSSRLIKSQAVSNVPCASKIACYNFFWKTCQRNTILTLCSCQHRNRRNFFSQNVLKTTE